MYMARCVDGSLYTGIAKNVRARLAAHNSGRGAAYTRSRRPVKLVYAEKGFTRSTALSREASIKALERPGKLALLKAARAAGRGAVAALALILCASLARAVPTFAKEENSAAWTAGFTSAFSSAAPQSFTFLGGATPFYPIRMYFIRQSSATQIDSASSSNGLAWTEDTFAGHLTTSTLPSVIASSITGCSVLPLSGGGFRMAYSIVSTAPAPGSYRIHTSTSLDGLHWSNDPVVVTANDPSAAVDNHLTYLSDPKLVQISGNSWRMYYVANTNGGTDIGHRQIWTAFSANQGATWGAPSVALSTMAFDVGASKLTSGLIRLYFSDPLPGSTTGTVVLSALSVDSNGTVFNMENGFRISTAAASGSISYPVPVRSTDTFRWRLYYDYVDTGTISDLSRPDPTTGAISTAAVHSALTSAPAPASVSPSPVLNSLSAVTLTINGEVFSDPLTSAAPTISFASGGQTLLPLAPLQRVSDQVLTANFSTLNLTPGLWDLTVTNGDGAATTLVGALAITFPPGNVALVNNLLRPRTGTSTAITVTTFNPGQILARLFTLDGRSVRTLFDGNQPSGVLNLSWDGRDGGGSAVASGVYLLHVTGPKLDTKTKIIVIR